MSVDIHTMSSDELRESMKNLATVISASTGELAVCLYVVQTKRYWEVWEYESLDAYAEEELGITRSPLQGYLKAGRVAVTRKLSLEEIKRLGKSKLAVLDALANSDKFQKAMDYAADHTESDLREYQQALLKGVSAVHDRTVKTWSVKVAADDFEEMQRLATMIQLEHDFKLNGDGLLCALRAYWSERKNKAA